jgi:transcription initiation factor TFIIH subunit 3
MDVLNLHSEDSIFLQQASHLTHGIYYRVRRKDGLLQYLNVCVERVPHQPILDL